MLVVGEELLEHLMAVGPYLKKIFDMDIAVEITDVEAKELIGYFPGEKVYFDENDLTLEDDDPVRLSVIEKRCVHSRIDKGQYGNEVATKGIVTPILDENENAIGAIGVSISLETESKILEISDHLSNALEQIVLAINEIAISSGLVKENEENLNNNINNVVRLIREITDALIFTKRLTDQTNILGVNARIEAGRAGQEGLGFGVIAQEIRKLSFETDNITNNINLLTEKINEANEITLKNSAASLTATIKQQNETEEVVASIEELKKLSQTLKVVAKEF